MFKKKKVEVQKSSYDMTVENLWKEMADHTYNLRLRVRDAYIKSIAVSVYPSGADKAKAESDLLKAQSLVLASIAHYDDARARYLRLLKDHRNELVVHADATASGWEESHAIVEKILSHHLWKN